MEIRGVGLTNVGLIRENNEDALHVDDDLGLYVVSDGMGGHAGGETASRTVVDAVVQTISTEKERLSRADPRELVELMRTAVENASHEVNEKARTTPALRGMGSTVTAGLFTSGYAILAHVGDCRAYLLRDGEVHQLTTDHTIAVDLFRSGLISAGSVRTHPHASTLSRAVGSQESVLVDTHLFDLQPGDRFLLCTDGLSDHVEDAAWLSSRLGGSDLESVGSGLMEHALAEGGKDNISVIIISVDLDHPVSSTSSRIDRILASSTLFEGLDLSQRARVRSLCHEGSTGSERVLLEPDEVCSGLYIVMAGEMVIRGRGREEVLGTGRFAGASALLASRTTGATLTASTGCEWIFLDGADFRSLALQRPWLGLSVLERLGRYQAELLNSAGNGGVL